MAKNYTSPLLQKYQKQYDKDPTSRVFAPLAETYRRLDMVDRAIEILREGIKHHPDYVMGYVGLAACYIDKEMWEQAYTSLRPFVAKYRDNLRLQKLFAHTCLALDHRDEALETYKFLLFMNPKDKEAAEQVRELEDHHSKVQSSRSLKEESDEDEESSQLFVVDNLSSGPDESSIYDDDIEGWETVDLTTKETERQNIQKKEDDEVSEWRMNETPSPVETDDVSEDVEIELEQNFDVKTREEMEAEVYEYPVITHTLVDLYISQGHLDKAKEILQRILELNPESQPTQKKLSEINELLITEDEASLVHEVNAEKEDSETPLHLVEEEEDYSDDEGHQDLLRDFDQQAQKTQREILLQKKLKLENFLTMVQRKAQCIKEQRDT